MRIHLTPLSFLLKLAISALCVLALVQTLGLVSGSLHLEELHYFAILLACAAAIYWLCDAVYVLMHHAEDEGGSVLEPSLKYALTMCLAVTAGATHFILKIGPFWGDGWDLPFLALHYLVPVLAVLDWLLFDRKGLMHGWGPLIWTAPLLLYILITELVVAGTGIDLGGDFRISGVGLYPYPFLDVTAKGPEQILIIVGCGYAFFTALGYVVFALDRLLSTVGRDAREAEAEAAAESARPIQPPLSAAPRHFRS
ncbi:MAG: Pr6Pr family membrane protein [Atopobiaceae bacterium]